MSDQINVNAIANTLQTKVDLPTGSSQSDVDFVIEWQAPTADNNYTWYRKYKSGWVEQGGILNGANTSITYPIVFADTNYYFNSFATIADGIGNTFHSIGMNKTTTGISIYIGQYGSSAAANSTYTQNWEAKGMSA